ncbi:hypothetical protein VTL71DRAFT_8146 [Oculimacula yallundae]|uniref:GRF-type domain-containing protein n=1 Tax=Oculimacula yallundae TaxID=86028 RepID=A0ABR4CX26_9HELO
MDPNQAAPQAVEEEEPNGKEENPFQAKKHIGWCGRFEADEWYCQCGRKAKYLPVTKKGRNFGKKFYMCPVREPKQEGDPELCRFFLWDDHQEEAKKWMESNPTTPKKLASKTSRELRTPNHGSSKKMAGWLSGNGKKRAANDLSDEDAPQEMDGDKQSDEDFVVIGSDNDENVFNQNNTRNGSPSRKAAKVTRFATPGQPLTYTLDGENALPTPVTGGRASENEARQRRARSFSPTPNRLHAAIDLDDSESEMPSGKTNLSKVVLGYIKADFPGLSELTETMICHEIETEAQRAQTDLKVCRMTIARLRREMRKMEKKMGDLEKTVHELCKGSFADDEVVLSD